MPPRIDHPVEGDSGRIAQTFQAMISLIAQAIAAELLPRLSEAVREGASPRFMSLRQSARAAKVRTEVVLAAVRLPTNHPGHLRSSLRPGASDGRRFVTTTELDLWVRSGGMRAARMACHVVVAKASS